MDFITGFPRTSRQHDSIMVVVGRLRKVAHYIVVKYTNLASEVAQVFNKENMRFHGDPKRIISNKYSNLSSRFWKEFFAGLRT